MTIDVEKSTREYEKLENAQSLHDLSIAYAEEIKIIEQRLEKELMYPDSFANFFKSTRRRFATLAKAVLKDEKDIWWYDEDRFTTRFNKILEDLYNVADERVTWKKGDTYKFIWIKTF